MVNANRPLQETDLDQDFGVGERLFHYTGSQGLYGILESGCLWATHFKYLNDSNEFFAAKESLKNFVEVEVRKKIAALKVSKAISLNEGVSLRELSGREAGSIVDSMYEATLKFSDPFVFSSYVSDPSSENFRKGELLHWATYARDGGYAIEINPHKLAALLGPRDNILSQKAIYVGDDVPPELKSDYEAIGKVAQEMILGILTNSLDKINLDPSAKAFMRVASVIKNRFFKDEKEARLVSMRLRVAYEGYTAPNVFIRHQQSRPVPYIKLFENVLLGEKSPIEGIIVGPHSEKSRRVEALSLFLEARGLSRINIYQSDVPYLSV